MQWVPELRVSTGTTLPVTCKHDTYGVSFHPDVRDYAIANGAPDPAPSAIDGAAAAAHQRPVTAPNCGTGGHRHLLDAGCLAGGVATDGNGSADSSAASPATTATTRLGEERDTELPGPPVSGTAAIVKTSALSGANDSDGARKAAQVHLPRSTGVPMKACRGISCAVY